MCRKIIGFCTLLVLLLLLSGCNNIGDKTTNDDPVGPDNTDTPPPGNDDPQPGSGPGDDNQQPPPGQENSAPEFSISPPDRTDVAGSAISAFSISATDVDNNVLLYSATNLPGGISINTATGEISGTLALNADNNSPYQVQISANDQTGTANAVASVQFSWTVTTKSNSQPVFSTTPANRSNIAGTTITPFTINATDADSSQTLRYSAVNLPNGTSINQDTGEISGTIASNADNNSPYSVQITADDQSDEANATAVIGFTWTITPIINVSINDISIVEGDSGVMQGALTVSLAQVTTLPISVEYHTENLNAGAGVDYITKTGTLEFPANGSTSQTILIEVLGDADDEPDELFRVILSNPVNSKLVDNQGLITIVNDDTRVAFSSAGQMVDESAGTINVVIQLAKTSSLNVTVPYAFTGAATRNKDYQHAIIANEVTLQANTLTTDLAITIVNDNVNGINEDIVITLQPPQNAKIGNVATHTITIQDNDLSRLNDTGATQCNDTVSMSNCPIAGFPRQDGDTGLDNLFLGDDANGKAGFSFTKLRNDGVTLPNTATVFACVRDNQTGLTWEVKTTAGLHSHTLRYTWFNPDPTANGGSAGFQSLANCNGANCNTHAFVNAVNAEGLCGFTDWRMPNYIELQSIIDYGTRLPAIDTNFFPNTANTAYWSGDPHINSSIDAALYLDFGSGAGEGESSNSEKTQSKAVRLVRGGEQ